MRYYKQKIGVLVRHLIPEDKKPLLNLTDHQKRKIRNFGELFLTIAVLGTAPLSAAVLGLIGYMSEPEIGRRMFNVSFRGDDQPNQRQMARKISQMLHYYEKKQRYIKLIPQGNDFQVKITQKGRKKIIKIRIDTLQIKQAKPWDKHWWAVVADVPVELKGKADLMREKIKELGFYPLQRTVWVHPYDPRDEIDFVSAYYGIEQYVTCMRVDQLDPEDEKAIWGHFRAQKLI